MQDKIKRMQDNLYLLRATLGWSAKELGERIGVTRQTINALENGKAKMTKTQYLAICYVMNEQVFNLFDESFISLVLYENYILDDGSFTKICKDHGVPYDELYTVIKTIAPSILTKKASRKAATKVLEKYISQFGIA